MNGVVFGEVIVIAVLLALAMTPFFVLRRRLPCRAHYIALGVMAVCLIESLVWIPHRDVQVEEYLPREVAGTEFVSSRSCKKCHADYYASWYRTFHRTMTQIASPKSIVPTIDDIHLESRGRKYRLTREGDEFWVHMADPEWEKMMVDRGMDLSQISSPPMVDRRILLTTGSHHYQTYWIPGRFGRELFQVPWVYHIQEQRWIPREDAFIVPPDSGRQFAHWNSNCIKCHAVAGNPGMKPDQLIGDPETDPQTGELFSEVVEFGIGCESCHGPGKDHVRFHQNPVNRYRYRFRKKPDPYIVNPKRCSTKVASQICGQCHSDFDMTDRTAWWSQGNPYRAGGDLEKAITLHRFQQADQQTGAVPDLYWDDGTVRVGGREYLGLIESPCYQRGELSCLSCHSMHDSDPNDQLAAGMDRNHACLQCHTSFRGSIPEHTHHQRESSGSQCYNCHMPHTSYALFNAIRSHRIVSPDVATSVRSGRPNACNLCHLDKTLQWSAQYLSQWYERPAVKLNDDEQTIAASLLWLLSGDAAQRIVVAWSMGWKPAQDASGTVWMTPFLTQLLDDPYSAVRFVAYRSLRRLPNVSRFEYDFIAPPEERSDAKTLIQADWKRQMLTRPDSIGLHAFFNDDGTIRNERIDRLLQRRDDRPMVFPE